MNEKTIYLIGSISGNEENYKQEFAIAQKVLEKLGDVFNPVELCEQFEITDWFQCIIHSLNVINTVKPTHYYKVNSCKGSAGATIEELCLIRLGAKELVHA
jgi:hypothetical protein